MVFWRQRGWLLALCTLVLLGIGVMGFSRVLRQPDRVQAAPLESHTYLPIVRQDRDCLPNNQEARIAQLMKDHPDQQRASLTCNPILADVARARAQDMVDRHYFSHTNPDGFGPNYLVTIAGYVLPSWYGQELDANNIESIAAGYSTPQAAWNGWMNSDGHRTHLLGEVQFFADQIEYGIGYASGGDYGHYWVVITAKPGP